MKTRLLSLAAVILGLFCGSVKADNVDLQTAKQIGAYYFTVATGAKAPVSADNLKLAQQFDNPTLCIPAMYAFNVAGEGFVVVSASDATEPILAYSPEGSINPNNMNPACEYLLNSYVKLIAEHQNNEAVANVQVQAKWTELKNQTFTCDLSKAGILFQTKWDQGDNYYPSYNTFCPQENDGRYCLTGCVATAMAQIIKYWNYPEVGGNDNSSIATHQWHNQSIKYKFKVDSNKFIYDSMPKNLSFNSPWNERRAIGKLMFACGVAVKMGWGADGSGAQSSDVPEALSKWFKYSTDITYKYRMNISDANWISILHSEITEHLRPVYYSGYDPSGSGRDAAGHAWVIAGESAADNTKFYINWGWGGNSNGFFTLAPASSIQTASGYNFNSGHAMVYKIFPKDLSIEETRTIATAPAYPNPASDYLMIPVDMANSAILGIYSIDGRLVESKVIPAGTNEYRLDLQNYATGTYVYRLNGSSYKFSVL